MSPESQLQRELREVRSDVQGLKVDVWFGKGTTDPPIVLRLAKLETSMTEVAKSLSDFKAACEQENLEQRQSSERKFNLILGGIVAVVGTLIVDLIVKR